MDDAAKKLEVSLFSEHVLKDILSSKKQADTGTSIEIISLDDLIN